MYTEEKADEYREVFRRWWKDADTGPGLYGKFNEYLRENTEPELKPCPFCGSEAEQRYRRGELSGYNPPLYGCSNKECILHELNASLDRWNRRSQWISVEGYYEGGEVLAHFPQIVAPEHAIVKKAFLGDNGHWWESGGRCLYMIPDYFQPLPSAPEDK